MAELAKERQVHVSGAVIVGGEKGTDKNKNETSLEEVERIVFSQQLGGYGLLRGICGFEFDSGEPEFTDEVKEAVRKVEKDSRGGFVKGDPLERIRKKNPNMTFNN